ncbi:MAG: hypothetical protein K2Q14_08590 [Gammaproteobacteria bacterium]|nr:hypothetical protein [Gammaproteobacteria bacterium]
MKNYCLSQLLPYDAQSKNTKTLKNELQDFFFLVKSGLAAITSFEQDNLEMFDSLVGENACQIRAICLIHIKQNSLLDMESLKFKFLDSFKKIHILLNSKKIDQLSREKYSLAQALEQENLNLVLTSDELFIIKAYLLTLARGENNTSPLISFYRQGHLVPKRLLHFGQVSSTFTHELCSHLRKLLSLYSVYFIQNTAHAIGNSLLSKMVGQEFTLLHGNCTCIPMFWTYKVVLELAKNLNAPILIHVKLLNPSSLAHHYHVRDEEYIVFEYDKGSDSYLESETLTENLTRPTLIIQGIACNDYSLPAWKAAFKKHSLFTVILAGAADHRQYPDEAKDELMEILAAEEYQYYKTLSQKEGFSRHNPSLFFIQHVYASLACRVAALHY